MWWQYLIVAILVIVAVLFLYVFWQSDWNLKMTLDDFHKMWLTAIQDLTGGKKKSIKRQYNAAVAAINADKTLTPEAKTARLAIAKATMDASLAVADAEHKASVKNVVASQNNKNGNGVESYGNYNRGGIEISGRQPVGSRTTHTISHGPAVGGGGYNCKCGV